MESQRGDPGCQAGETYPIIIFQRGRNAETAALGDVIVRKVRHVQGVVAVRDRLSYPDADASIAGPGF